uniref:Endonuclease/exonuclease/phosphatase domain-containing protein n=1 Tax=Aegilops tauschii TaxID=37682 RepID=M8BIW6_AEGTA
MAPEILPATCELRWGFLEEERMMQYNRDKYFPQLRTNVINPVGEPRETSLTTPTHKRANTSTQRDQGGCQPPWRLFIRIKSDNDRWITKTQNIRMVNKLQQARYVGDVLGAGWLGPTASKVEEAEQEGARVLGRALTRRRGGARHRAVPGLVVEQAITTAADVALAFNQWVTRAKTPGAFSRDGHPPQTPFPGPQYGYGTPNQYGHWHPQPYSVVPPNGGFLPRNAGFRPAAPQLHPSLAQYKREWRSVQKLPPRHAERFKVLSYNILADYLAQEHQDLYRDIPSFIMDWNWRKNRIGLEISWWRPDIICFQEVDKFTDLEQEMSTRGYSGIWKMRTGNAVDGCAIFWRTARFRLCYKEDIEFNKLGLRDNVAQLCVLEIRTLLDQAYATSKRWNDAPVILCGDFNAAPKSPFYFAISCAVILIFNTNKLNLFGLARNAISGQQTSSHGLYTGSNTSRSCSGPSNLEEQGLSSCLAGLAKDAYNSDGEDHVKATEREDGVAVDSSSEECSGGIKVESKEPDVGGVQCSQTDVCDAAFQSDSSEAIDGRHLLSSYELSGRIDSVRELRGVIRKDSNSQGDLSGNVICEDVTGGFEGNSFQSDTSLNVSKENPGEKEKCNESMSGQNNYTIPESESSHFSDSLKSADARDKMSNMRVEEEINTGSTHLTSPVELTHQINSATSDSCGNQCTPEVTNKHLDSYSCPEEFGNHACSVEDDVTANENLCSNVISDPTSFKEFSGDNECLHVDNDQLPKISNGSLHAHKVVPYGGYYNDPYRWTVDEIKAATGKEECTYVEHNLKVRSVYTDVEDFNGTKDANKEPLVTSYNRKFMGTVDYVWASEDLQTVSVLDTFPEVILKETNGFPTKKWGSDHIALVCELAFKE